jgi:phosphoserine aminotransferase
VTSVAATGRIHNFSAGPGALPESVLMRARDELLDWHGRGLSVMEMSHRSAAFEEILGQAEGDLRVLLGLSDDFAALFLQGGASLQFSMLPLNLRPAGASADYVLTGAWSQAALKEARKGGAARVAGSSESEGFTRVPAQAELDLDPRAAYLHFTSNNTIYGTEWFREPVPPAGVPLVCDFSSDALSRPLDVERYGLLYAGAQKNLGPAGVTLACPKTCRRCSTTACWRTSARSTTRRRASRSTSRAWCWPGCAPRADSARWSAATGTRPNWSTPPSTAAAVSTAVTHARTAARA